jgi:hypothetical protein
MSDYAKAPLYWDASWMPVSSIYSGGPKKLGICIHHQAGTGKDLSGIFNSRGVSAHYSVGPGYIYQYVREPDRAWHTGTDYGNNYLIGIETANSSTGGSWPVSDGAIDSLVQCLVGIAQNQGWKELYWHGDKNTPGYVCAHRDLAATACCGDYLYARCPEIVAKANAILAPAPSPGKVVSLWQWHGGGNQQWIPEIEPDGTYAIKNVASGLYLDVSGSSDEDGTEVCCWPCHGGDNQRFVYLVRDVELACLAALISALPGGRCLDITGSSKTNGAKAIIYHSTDGLNQRFILVPVAGSEAYYIMAAHAPGMCLDCNL